MDRGNEHGNPNVEKNREKVNPKSHKSGDRRKIDGSSKKTGLLRKTRETQKIPKKYLSGEQGF